MKAAEPTTQGFGDASIKFTYVTLTDFPYSYARWCIL